MISFGIRITAEFDSDEEIATIIMAGGVASRAKFPHRGELGVSVAILA